MFGLWKICPPFVFATMGESVECCWLPRDTVQNRTKLFCRGPPMKGKKVVSAVIFSQISFLSCILSLPNYNLLPFLIPFVSQPVIL